MHADDRFRIIGLLRYRDSYEQQQGKGSAVFVPSESGAVTLRGAAGMSIPRVAPELPGLNAAILTLQLIGLAGHSRYLFECHAVRAIRAQAAWNEGGTTEARTFRPLRRKVFLFFY
jgi:hypothetical protein